jgi:hypothetical protein
MDCIGITYRLYMHLVLHTYINILFVVPEVLQHQRQPVTALRRVLQLHTVRLRVQRLRMLRLRVQRLRMLHHILLRLHTIRQRLRLLHITLRIVQQQPLQLRSLQRIVRPDQQTGRLTFMRSILRVDDELDKDIPDLLSDKTKELTEVEDYFLNKVKEYDFEVSYDCTAEEPVNWKTLNYTTYAGCFIMHPLRGEAAKQQMIEAYAHGKTDTAWSDHFLQKLKEGSASKYKKRSEVNPHDIKEHIECLVVLAGHNKLAKHTCAGSLVRLHKKFPEHLYYKKHPISDQSVYDGLFNHLLNEGVEEIKSFESEYELYDLMAWAGCVATGFASESALYAAVEEIPLFCTDLYQNAITAPFYHINWFLFSLENPKHFVDTAFNSYKSGIINPNVDANWESKINRYLEHIKGQRKRFGDMYVG